MFWFHVTGMWRFYRQRRREEFKKALEGSLKFFPGIKIFPSPLFLFRFPFSPFPQKRLILRLPPSIKRSFSRAKRQNAGCKWNLQPDDFMLLQSQINYMPYKNQMIVLLWSFLQRKQSAAYMRREGNHLYEYGLHKTRTTRINGSRLSTRPNLSNDDVDSVFFVSN